MQAQTESTELLTIRSGDLGIPYEWSIGKYGSRFFAELKNHQRFIGIRCPKCLKIRTPPRKVCGPCYTEMDELVELGNTGVIRAFSMVNYPFIDPATGVQREIPYTYGYITIDGTDNIFSHIINETNVNKIRVGMKVKAIFREKEEMQGNIQDIKYFEIIE